MKLAFTTLACPDWTFDRCVEAARRYGYAGQELRLLVGRIIGVDAKIREYLATLAILPPMEHTDAGDLSS
jgi:hypothetical protein